MNAVWNKTNTINIKWIIALLFLGSAMSTGMLVAKADAQDKVDEKSPWDLTVAVPLIKLRQGEDFRVFDGAAGGLKWSPYINDGGFAAGFHLSGLLMVSSFDEPNEDTADPSDTDRIDVLSIGFVVGIKWLEVGIGWDLVSSETSEDFDAREKMFFMVNLQGTVEF